MPKFDIRKAELEKQEDDAVGCRTCSAPAHEQYEPYCMSCGIYWKDCDEGLFADPLCSVCGIVIMTGELCAGCAKDNDPFVTCDNVGKDLK
jgi:hypothetical protein